MDANDRRVTCGYVEVITLKVLRLPPLTLQSICVTNDNVYVPFVVLNHNRSFPTFMTYHRFLT